MVERDQIYLRTSISVVLKVDQPGLAAHLAILDVLLQWSAARIDRDLHSLVAIRTVDGRRGFRGTITEREVSIQIFVAGGAIVGVGHP